MNSDQVKLTKIAAQKTINSIQLVEDSLKKIKPYNNEKIYSSDELEPYDALSDRFIRSIEISIKFFRSYEIYLYGEISQTLRDLLNKMASQNLVSSVQKWMEMRDVRNRIVHDYLPDEIKDIYDSIMDEYGNELIILKKSVLIILKKLGNSN